MRSALYLAFLLTQHIGATPAFTWNWPTWPPLNDKVWQITPADHSTRPEAIVLNYTVRFIFGYTVHFKRILVLSPAGKASAELQNLSGEVLSFEGRVIQPNGSITQLVEDRDLIKSTLLSAKDWKVKNLKILTPNLSNHCVVDYRWIEPTFFNTLAATNYSRLSLAWSLANTVPIINLSLIVEEPFLTFTHQGFEVDPTCQPKVEKGSGFMQYSFANVPPIRKEPFASTADLGRPRFSLFYTPSYYPQLTKLYGRNDLSDLKLDFWLQVAQIQYWIWFEDGLSKSWEFARWSDRLCKDLPPDPETKARTLLRHLQRDIKPIFQLTHAERALLPKGELPSETKPKDLDETVASGYASAYGLRLLFFQLLKKAGLNPIIVETVNRHTNRFRANQENWGQFDRTLIGIRTSQNNLTIFDPASRWTAGEVDPAYQGSGARLVITDPDRKKWHTLIETIPESISEQNFTNWTYTINPSEDADAIQVKGTSSGAQSWSIRDEIGAFSGLELGQSFTKLMSPDKLEIHWEKFKVENVSSPEKVLSWEGAGTQERTSTRVWSVKPFPGLILPFPIPAQWPESRTRSIHLPFKSRIEAESKILIPKGFVPPATFQAHNSNAIGEVDWSLRTEVKPDGTEEAIVRLVIETKKMQAPANEYGQLKEWILWVQNALGSLVQVKKSDATR